MDTIIRSFCCESLFSFLDSNKEIFKFYALGCISAETGARGDRAQAKNEEISDSRDTMFHSRYWTDGVQRLLSIDDMKNHHIQKQSQRQYLDA